MDSMPLPPERLPEEDYFLFTIMYDEWVKEYLTKEKEGEC